jgi:RNA polymerase-interacting CarD/CdnL/TRCF family regulator
MDFTIGDRVIHRYLGEGTVVSIEAMGLSGSSSRLFYRVEFPKTTLWAAMGDQTPGGLRRITPKNQLYLFRALLKSSPMTLDTDFRSRQKELENRAEAGTFRSLCEIVRDLSAWNRIKPLNGYEKNLLKKSRASLAAEWSSTSGMAVNDALQEIDDYLLKGKQASTVD